MTDVAYSSRSASLGRVALGAVVAMAKMAAEVAREWRHNYRSRRELAMYSRSERSDLSFAPDVDVEIAKPFWRK